MIKICSIIIIAILLYLFFSRDQIIISENMSNVEVHRDDDYNV
jgi:hypothetical protein